MARDDTTTAHPARATRAPAGGAGTEAVAPRGIDALFAHGPIYLFGASAAAPEVEAVLARHGRAADGYFDNATAKHGTVFRGKPVMAPSAAPDVLGTEGAVAIAAPFQTEIATQLIEELGVAPARVFPFVSPMFAGHFGPGAAPAPDTARALAARLADGPSRDYLAALLAFRLRAAPMALRRNPRLEGFYDYAAPDLAPGPGDVAVDVGAYTGDTAEVFLKRMNYEGTVVAVEPVPANVAALKEWRRARDLGASIRLIEAAAGARAGTLSLATGGGADPKAHVAAGAGGGAESHTVRVAVDTLDRLLGEEARIDYLKIDIEGAEPEALEGAAGILRRFKPKLALAGYHRPDHLWTLPALLDRIVPGYEIFLGHHPSAAYECELFCRHPDRA